MAFMMDALWMIWVGISNARARKTISVCVVALASIRYSQFIENMVWNQITQTDPQQQVMQHLAYPHPAGPRHLQPRPYHDRLESAPFHRILPCNRVRYRPTYVLIICRPSALFEPWVHWCKPRDIPARKILQPGDEHGKMSQDWVRVSVITSNPRTVMSFSSQRPKPMM